MNIAALYKRPDEAARHNAWVKDFAAAIKRRYDPTNLFRLNHNMTPVSLEAPAQPA